MILELFAGLFVDCVYHRQTWPPVYLWYKSSAILRLSLTSSMTLWLGGISSANI